MSEDKWNHLADSIVAQSQGQLKAMSVRSRWHLFRLAQSPSSRSEAYSAIKRWTPNVQYSAAALQCFWEMEAEVLNDVTRIGWSELNSIIAFAAMSVSFFAMIASILDSIVFGILMGAIILCLGSMFIIQNINSPHAAGKRYFLKCISDRIREIEEMKNEPARLRG